MDSSAFLTFDLELEKSRGGSIYICLVALLGIGKRIHDRLEPSTENRRQTHTIVERHERDLRFAGKYTKLVNWGVEELELTWLSPIRTATTVDVLCCTADVQSSLNTPLLHDSVS